MRFNGLYARTAKQLGVDPSFVSKVASGKRNSDKVTQALEAEMKRLEKLKPR
jgi:predicted transcriptional regulator